MCILPVSLRLTECCCLLGFLNSYYFSVQFSMYLCIKCGRGSSVSVATDCGLDGPGSNPGGDEIFCPSRPALGPTQPRSFQGDKERPGRAADHSPPSSAMVKKE